MNGIDIGNGIDCVRQSEQLNISNEQLVYWMILTARTELNMKLTDATSQQSI